MAHHTRRTAHRAALTTTASASLLLALTGCIQYDADLTVQTDDTVDGRIVIAVEDAVLDALHTSADDVLPAAKDVPFGQDVTSEAYAADGRQGRTYVFDDVSFDELAASSSEAHTLRFDRADGEVTVDGRIELFTIAKGEGLADRLGAGEVSVSVSFPGEVISTNGKRVGDTVTWTGPASEPLVIEARATDGLEGQRRIARNVATGLAAVPVAVAGVLWLVLRRRPKVSVPADEVGGEDSAL